MIYFENCSYGKEGWNTHVYSWTLCIALSNFLDRDFYFDYEVPSPRPPEYVLRPEFKDRFKLIIESPRSLVSDLVDIPNRRVDDIDRSIGNMVGYQLTYSYFATTDAIRKKLEGTVIWDSFAVGRSPLIREELNSFDLIEWTHSKLSSVAYFFLLGREEKAALLRSVAMRFRADIEALAERIARDVGPHYAVHVRLSDFDLYTDDGYHFDSERFEQYLDAVLPDRSLPLMIATDALYEKELIERTFRGFKTIFIDELIFDEYRDAYESLEFRDYNVLTILNQLLCGSAERFVGTYRSTVTGIVHRLRQERLRDREFYYWPEPRIRKVLSTDFRLTPDRSGFFDWNRFSVLSEAHPQMSWMREWDYELTTLDL
jgi:hypothetical protein